MKIGLGLLILSLLLYIGGGTFSIYGGDAGDLVAAAYTAGIPHPPGFPLYTFLGFILTRINLATPAYMVGLISSISSSFTLFFLYIFLCRIIKDRLIALLTTATLGFNYLFWLYAIVPEVFALHIFFMSLLILLMYLWSETNAKKWLYLFIVVLGLSLSHHHIILFAFPGLFYWLYIQQKSLYKYDKKFFFTCLSLFMLGFLSYLYLPISAFSIPKHYWGDPVSLKNFIALVSRAVYGSFSSGPYFAASLQSRLLQFPLLLEFIKNDFTLVGIFFIVIGAVNQFKKRRKIFNFVLIGYLFTGPFFFFYASYFVVSAFNLATYERFLLPSYFFLIFWLSEGMIFLYEYLINSFKKLFKNRPSHFARACIYGLMLILPLSLFYINAPKILILKNDMTAENMAYDILDPLEANSILILQSDTPLFNSQYAHFALGVRPDLAIFHFQKLVTGDHNKQIKKYYPDIKIPPPKKDFMTEFVRLNYGRRPIYSNYPIPVVMQNVYWLRYGMTFRFVRAENLPSTDDFISENDRIWTRIHDPLQGSLSIYKNLMLSNVLDFYKDSYLQAASLYAREDIYKKAHQFLDKAKKIDAFDARIYDLESTILIKEGRCQEAEKKSLKAIKLNPNENTFHETIISVYEKCLKNPKKAAYYQKLLESRKKSGEIKLQKL